MNLGKKNKRLCRCSQKTEVNSTGSQEKSREPEKKSESLITCADSTCEPAGVSFSSSDQNLTAKTVRSCDRQKRKKNSSLPERCFYIDFTLNVFSTAAVNREYAYKHVENILVMRFSTKNKKKR